MSRPGTITLATVLCTLIGAAPWHAKATDNYPSRPVTIVVPFTPGGSTDIMARYEAEVLQRALGQSFVIENKPGAGARLAGEYAANQPADGYTLLVSASGGMSIASAIYPKLGYHPTKSFVPLTMIANFPLIMVGQTTIAPKTVAELVAYAKANPNKSNYGTTSPAFTIASELLKLKTGAPAVAIPLKSSAEMILCVIQEQCLFSISDGPPAIPQIKDGKVRALAVTGSERSPELPDVPSMAEAGFPEVNTKLWSGMFAPASTPPAIVNKLQAAFSRAIRDPGVSGKLRGMAVNPGGGTSDEFRKMIDADIESYVAVVKAANLKFEQ